MTDSLYTEISCSRAINGELFSQGIMDFPFSISSPSSFVPSKSFFGISLQLNKGTSAPIISDQIAYADNCAGNLFTTASFRFGGVEVSKTTSYAKQASILKTRAGSTHAYLKTIGKDCAMLESSFSKRIQQVSRDYAIGSRINESKNIMYKLPTSASTIAYDAATGVIARGVGTEDLRDFVNEGDEVVIKGISFIIRVVEQNQLTATATGGTAITASTDYYFITRDLNRNPQGHNIIYAIYQPPLGLFDIADNIGSGDYKISLNPNAYYKQACVQSFKNKATSSGILPDYTVSVLDVKFYAYIEKCVIPDGVKTLNLYELNLQSKNYADNLQFSIPSTTQKISVFTQHPEANMNSKYPPSNFTCVENIDLKMKSIQLTYGGISKTSTIYESFFISKDDENPVSGTNYSNMLQQRYLESYENISGQVGMVGCESYSDWLERGLVFHFDFTRDHQSHDTELQLNLTNSSTSVELTNMKVFVVSWYRTAVSYDSANGAIQSVKLGSL